MKSLSLTLIQDSPPRLEGSWTAKTQFDPFNPLNSIIPLDPSNSPNRNQCVGGTISLTKANLPPPFTGDYGTVAYYDFRNNDYLKRNPQRSPPIYYLGFGKKNLSMFLTNVYPNVSAEGQSFLEKVARILQQKIENKLISSPKAFADLEDDSDAFQDFAYATHYPAYCEAGWSSLKDDDKDKIISAIELKDKYFNLNGLVVGFKIKFLCDDYKKPEQPKKPDPVKDKLKGIWNQIKKP